MENARLTAERDDHESRAELLDTVVLPLEEQRRQLQALVTEATTALIEVADVPTVKLPDEQIPFYYASNSWEDAEEVPWDPEKGEPMTLAEGIKWIRQNVRKPKRAPPGSTRSRAAGLEQRRTPPSLRPRAPRGHRS